MREIQPLGNATRQAAGRVKSSPQFVFKTRTWVAVSMTGIDRLRKNRITPRISSQVIPIPIDIAKPHPMTGVHFDPPRIKARGRSSSHTWEAEQAWPTAGSRQP